MNNFLILAQAEAEQAQAQGMGPLQYVFGAVYVVVCILMIVAILAKTPKNDGLGGLTGGGGGDANFKGSKSKDDQIDTLTNWIAVAFLAMSIGMNFVF